MLGGVFIPIDWSESPLTMALAMIACVVACLPALALFILVHEAVHAVSARLLGMKLLDVEVGAGRQLLRFHALGCDWVMRPYPAHGLVRVVLPDAGLFRTRHALVYLSAPVVCAALAVLQGLAVLHALKGVQVLLFLPLYCASGAVLCAAAIGLMPTTLQFHGITLASDVLAAGRLVRLTDEQVQERVRGNQRVSRELESWELFNTGRAAQALERERAARAKEPPEHSLSMTVFLWAVAGPEAALAAMPAERARAEREVQEQREAAREIDPNMQRRIEQIVAMLDVNEAFFAVETDRTELLPIADQLSHHAWVREPDNPACLRTRGLVELRLGNLDHGMELLRDAWRIGEARWLAAACACYLAYGHALRGEAKASRKFLRKAARLHPSPTCSRATRSSWSRPCAPLPGDFTRRFATV